MSAECPGCYAYGDAHLGDGAKAENSSDFRGDALVNGMLELVERYDPIHISFVGGDPLIRHRELSRVLPLLSQRGTFIMVVTSAVIPIPVDSTALPRITVAVSIDGLPPEHDIMRILHQADRPFSSEADHPFSREVDQCSPVKSISVLR